MYSYNEVFTLGSYTIISLLNYHVLSTKHIERGQEILNNISKVINESNTNDFIFFGLLVSWLFLNIFFIRSIVKKLMFYNKIVKYVIKK